MAGVLQSGRCRDDVRVRTSPKTVGWRTEAELRSSAALAAQDHTVEAEPAGAVRADLRRSGRLPTGRALVWPPWPPS